jgi:hypothetical protein
MRKAAMTRSRRSSWQHRARARTDSWPPVLAAAAEGVYFILAYASARGARVLLPIALIALLARSPTPWTHLGLVLALFALCLFGGACSGVAFHLLGNLRGRMWPAGDLLVGVAGVAPYLLVLTYVVRWVSDGRGLLTAPDAMDGVMVGCLSLFFGGGAGVGLAIDSRDDRRAGVEWDANEARRAVNGKRGRGWRDTERPT